MNSPCFAYFFEFHLPILCLTTMDCVGHFCGDKYPPPTPPVSFPTPCRSPGGGGGASLGQPKIFRCGSLCCCVGGCVVGHYHLHPLHSWHDILLTFAEMELDNTTMFPPGTSGEHVQEFKVKWSRTKKFYTEPVKE